jgi:hypothetical protein
MKGIAMRSTTDILAKIETIEKEITDLKLIVLRKLTPTGKKVITLKGILKGVKIDNGDIFNAQKSLYGKIGV